ncbi:MAG: transcriptional regulator [Salinarimonas sp.]
MEQKPAQSMDVAVRISGALKDHVERALVHGGYETADEYLRDLVRRDKAARDDAAFEAVRDTLQAAFAEPESAYVEMTADDIRPLAANRGR